MAEPHQHVVFIVAIVVTAIAGWLDWRRGEIPNWLTYGAIGLGPILHVSRFIAAHEPMEAALMQGAYSFAGILVCLLVPLFLYRQGALGGGDLKLIAAIGALLQTMNGIEAEMYGFFAAALLAPAKLAYEGTLLSALKNAFTLFTNFFVPESKKRPVEQSALSWFRLGPALFVGVALTAYLHW